MVVSLDHAAATLEGATRCKASELTAGSSQITVFTGDTVTPADLVGLTESQDKHLYEMDQCGFNIDLIDDEEFIF
jgi:hypothetical protein